MKKIVISQPMFFPWVGLFEQIRLSDVYIHYDDVQYPQGRSFINRVQIKTANGVQWMTVPVQREGTRLIKDTHIDDSTNWREKHLKTLRHAYANCPYYSDMMKIVESVFSLKCKTINELNIYAIEKICEYFAVKACFCYSSYTPNDFRSTEKLLYLVRQYEGDTYITGWGAKNYLDHEFFEQSGVRVEYMDYQKKAYSQKYGEFTPFVSILDLIANKGESGKEVLCSPTIYWKKMLSNGRDLYKS